MLIHVSHFEIFIIPAAPSFLDRHGAGPRN
jgi:hypothetical protein